MQRLVAGGVAGAVSKTVIAPGDRIKILYQVTTPPPPPSAIYFAPLSQQCSGLVATLVSLCVSSTLVLF